MLVDCFVHRNCERLVSFNTIFTRATCLSTIINQTKTVLREQRKVSLYFWNNNSKQYVWLVSVEYYVGGTPTAL